jgi:hypothetical protein
VGPWTFALALLFAGAVQATAPGRPAPPRPGLSWAEADVLAQALADVERSVKAGQPAKRRSLVVTESQLNSYLNLTLASKMPPGLSEVVVRLASDGLLARANVDLDRVPIKRPTDGSLSLYSMLSGVVPVEISGRLEGRDGMGTIDLEQARLGGWSVPASVVAQLVSSSTRSAAKPQGLDIRAPFRLPYAMKRVRLEPGRAVVEFSGDPGGAAPPNPR